MALALTRRPRRTTAPLQPRQMVKGAHATQGGGGGFLHITDGFHAGTSQAGSGAPANGFAPVQAAAPKPKPPVDFRDSQYYDSISGLGRARSGAYADADLQRKNAGFDRDSLLRQLQDQHMTAQRNQAENMQRQNLFFSSTFDRARNKELGDYADAQTGAQHQYQGQLDAADALQRNADTTYGNDSLAQLYAARDRGLTALGKAPAPDSGVPDDPADPNNNATVLALFKKLLAAGKI